MKENNEAYRLEDMVEIIPTWYERWGISALAVVFLLFLSMAAIIRYPTVLTAGIDIATDLPPVKVYARQAGNYVPFVGEGSQVEAQTPLGIIMNPVKHDDILQLKKTLETTLQKSDYRNLDKLDHSLILGDMQDLYSLLVEEYQRYVYLSTSRFQEELQGNLESQIRQTDDLRKILTSKKALLKEQQELFDKKIHRDSFLLNIDGISQQSLELAKAEWLEKKGVLTNVDFEIFQNDLQKQKLEEALLISQKENSDAYFQVILSLRESIKRMLGAISEWEQKYLLSAPISGRVTYLQKFSKNQFINPNEAILSVVPDDGTYIGKITLPVKGSGKVQPGQRVKIRLDHFPYQEYGTLEGIVGEVSLVPNEGNYLIAVSLNHQLKTSYNITIPFKQYLSGSASIITEDLSLLQRIFGHIIALFDKNIQL